MCGLEIGCNFEIGNEIGEEIGELDFLSLN